MPQSGSPRAELVLSSVIFPFDSESLLTSYATTAHCGGSGKSSHSFVKENVELVVIFIITRALTRAYLVSKTAFALANPKNGCCYLASNCTLHFCFSHLEAGLTWHVEFLFQPPGGWPHMAH